MRPCPLRWQQSSRLIEVDAYFTEVDAYFTQEEISHMMASSREKVSAALNRLRDRAIVQYARGGHLLLDVHALENWEEASSGRMP